MLKCAICKNLAPHIIFENKYKKAVSKNSECFYKCDKCGLIFIYPQAKIMDINSYYEEKYCKLWELDIDSVKRNKSYTFKKWLDEIERYCAGGKILDVGCATGFFLEEARNRGWIPYGAELSEYSSKIAKKNFGDKIFTGTLSGANFTANSMDVVTMFDVLEHSPDPVNLLKEAHRVLKHNGLLCIATPNTESFFCKIMGRNWPEFKPEHLFTFGKKNIIFLLSIIGYTLVKFKNTEKYLTFNYIKSYFYVYQASIITKVMRLMNRILPYSLRNYSLPIKFGEMFIVAKKK